MGSIVQNATATGAITSLVVNKPTGTIDGDVMVAVLSGDWASYAAMTAPAGWNFVTGHDVGTDALHLKFWTKTAVGEGASYTFGQGASSDGVASITTVRGVVEAGLIAPTPTYTATLGTTRTCPTVTGANTGAVLLCGAMCDGSGSAGFGWSPPSGMAEQVDAQSQTFTSHSVASLLTPTNPTGTKDFSTNQGLAAGGGIQWSLVLQAYITPPPRMVTKAALSRSFYW